MGKDQRRQTGLAPQVVEDVVKAKHIRGLDGREVRGELVEMRTAGERLLCCRTRVQVSMRAMQMKRRAPLSHTFSRLDDDAR